MATSPELTGGAGFSFEDASVAIYLAALLGEESASGLSNRIVTHVAVQRAALGEPLDDLIVDATGNDGSEARLSLQVKRALTVSAARSNSDFEQIILRAWATLAKPDFRENADRVGVVTGTISEGMRRAFDEVCEWARVSSDHTSFLQRFEAEGFAGNERKMSFSTVRNFLGRVSGVTDASTAAYRLLRHFVLIHFNLLTEGSTDDAHAIERLRHQLHPDERTRAADLWARLLQIARAAAGRAGEFDRAILVRSLAGAFRLAGAPSLTGTLARLTEEATYALADIRSEIDGFELPRIALQSDIDKASLSHRFSQIVGLPGTGKSAALKEYAISKRKNGNILFLKFDRLNGSNWMTYAQSLGVTSGSLETLLVEIEATGTPILLIDGLDRIAQSHHKIITDLVNAILQSSELNGWKIVATLRDNGIEPLRTWLPPALFKQTGIATVEVQKFSEEEARALASAKPALKHLLFGEERVQDIARRAFFADILARALLHTGQSNTPTAETELVEAWWLRGGYNSDGSSATVRQRTLIKLARAGATTPHRRIKVEGLDADALHELKADGVIRDGRAGHTVVFTHDIFFEWSFLHVLLDNEDNWIGEIKAAGEPPVLGRVVELLSQATTQNFAQWEAHLAAIEQANVRPQWKRAWLTAVFGSPQFRANEDKFTTAMLKDNSKHLAQLVVWYQAERTKPNPNILDRSGRDESLSRQEIIRHADMLAWPSDLRSWQRFLGWIIRHVDAIPVTILPDILSAFQVWQNMLADYPNNMSERLIQTVYGWLVDVEDHEHTEEFSFDHGRWNELGSDERDEFEERLREILLRSARREVDRVKDYLLRVTSRRRLRDEAFNQIAGWASFLVENHAKELVELTLTAFKKELPEEIIARDDEWQLMGHSFDPFEAREMAISEPKGGYFPASPLREPFASLFEKAPAEAHALVRQLSNHAITAWRQLNQHSRRHQRATPIPLALTFPWGNQTFWGDQRIYVWPHGHWGPAPLMSGFMSLERWAFVEVGSGRPVDDVIRDLLEGHESCAVLNIAAALIVETQTISPVTLPIATAQRVWRWEVHRMASGGSLDANLIGFMRPSDLPHAKAVQELNQRPSRKSMIPYLSLLFVLSHDAAIAAEAQKSIQAFPSSLPFEYEEERENKEHAASLLRTAQIWAESGKPENYKAEPTPDGKHIKIELENPTRSDPDVVQSAQRTELLNDQLTVLNWVVDSFKRTAVSDRLTLQNAFERARARHRFRLFKRQHHRDFNLDHDQSLVAGTAAIAARYGGELAPSDLRWCRKILLQASATPEFTGEMWSAGSILLYHPALYSARGLPGLIRRGHAVKEGKEALLKLAGHPLEAVSTEALEASFSLWDLDANFAWIAFNLGLRISTGLRGKPIGPYGYDNASRTDHINKAVALALDELRKGKAVITLPPLPKPWVNAPPNFGGHERPRAPAEPVWREPDEFLRWDFLPKVISTLPVPALMADELRRPAFLGFCEELLGWMIERINPSWRNGEDRDREDRHYDNFQELKRAAMKLFAKAALHLEVSESERRFLEPIFKMKDKDAASLVHPFADWLVVSNVLDTPTVSSQTIPLLQACLTRILKDRSWTSARRRDGQLHGYDLPFLVKTFTFTSIERADLAARYANGDWKDLPIVMPLVDQLVRQVGDVPDVTYAFTKLCERAIEHYPAEVFASQVLAIVEKQPRTPVGWRGLNIPSRIAGLIHAFAEKQQPLPADLAQTMLRTLDRLVDMGDRRSAALQSSEVFKDVRLPAL